MSTRARPYPRSVSWCVAFVSCNHGARGRGAQSVDHFAHRHVSGPWEHGVVWCVVGRWRRTICNARGLQFHVRSKCVRCRLLGCGWFRPCSRSSEIDLDSLRGIQGNKVASRVISRAEAVADGQSDNSGGLCGVSASQKVRPGSRRDART